MKQSELKNKIDELEQVIEEGILNHASVWTLNKEMIKHKEELNNFKALCTHVNDDEISTFQKNDSGVKCSICGKNK